MALCQASKESVWMVSFLKCLGISLQGPMVVNADNQGSIALAKNPVFHDHSKHINIQHHFIHDLIKEGRIHLNYVPTNDVVADLLTKALPHPAHGLFSKAIGLF